MLLLAAFESLLCRYSHQEDFAVGIPFAGREDTQLEGLIGFFVSTLVIRADLSGDPTFQELLSRVRQKSLAAYDHQALPLQVLLADLQPARHMSRAPLFQVMFQLLTRAESSLDLPGLKVIDQNYGGNRVKFDLELHLSRHTGDISGAFYYSTDLFDSETIQRMALHYVRLLESIVANPNEKVGRLEFLTQQERSELLIDFNDTAEDYPRELCVHELFEQQVQKTPDTVAVVFEDQQLTYGELNARANRLARYLRSKGVGIETPVGMCLERSQELIITILGILKAGGTYVPLDAEYPTKRLEQMLADSCIKHLVTESAFLGKLPETDRLDICIDTDANPIAGEKPEHLGIEIDSMHLAYIIFTSGSTGQPKGVMIEHRSATNLLLDMADRLSVTHEDRLLSVTTPTFDISVLEFFVPLVTGGSVEIASKIAVRDPRELIERLDANSITWMQSTPSRWDLLFDSGWKGDKRLKVLSGGEPLNDTLANRIRTSCFGLWNVYGPTETTVWSTGIESHAGEKSCCIGRPIANTQIYILDANRALVPIGVAGELCIGGDGLARGYLNRPDLTAERFVTNPYSQDPHSRLYRTGDLCRWRADGNIEYLGRIDHQVKLRGFRIELGEIESTLVRHPAIAQCVVILREDRPGDKRLVAYYTAAGELLPSVAQLREHLGASLPEYMIPSAFVLLDALPLTPSGKIDRRALPAVELKNIGTEDQYTPARNGIEEQLVQIWQEILGIERIGIHDNFFALGGHSLLAVQLFHAIHERFQKFLPISLVFQRGSIAQIATFIDQAIEGSPIARVVRLAQAHTGPKLIVMPGLNGQLLYSLKLVEHLKQRFDICGLEPNLSREYLETFGDFRRLANEYLKIILAHQPSGPFNFVGYSYGGFLGYEIARQLQQLGHRVDFVGVIDTGPDPGSSSKDFRSLAKYAMQVLGNLPGWIGANCGPEDIKETAKKANRRLRYLGRRIISGGKTEYRFEDEFGHHRSHDSRREILGRIFQGFHGYQPGSYAGRVTLFRASVRPLLQSLSPDLGWSSVAQEVIVHRVAGDHDTILEPVGMKRMCDLIIESATLQRVT
jgi:amino acid adenylation domain-containing protein